MTFGYARSDELPSRGREAGGQCIPVAAAAALYDINWFYPAAALPSSVINRAPPGGQPETRRKGSDWHPYRRVGKRISLLAVSI